ncbi:SGNH/GDSL hydrolase family protein [Aeoliella sp. ICT_H6.2]|uniref:SGNH/GDSL hydrolase family protein n=1 Tax=Aeoliella straminimaris TaxID=2954799 RepID=A0A9X2F8U4_9BACT|nr:SGNH/GDSL hydrolase family protein [Aeoliella straminimaris]MCO6044480.1 SGNH/GDSL hydrolase family protein [Aeoliella straminimaris]
MSFSLDRRSFFQGSVVAAGLAAGGAIRAEETSQPASTPLLGQGTRILFQGDSITDAGRKKGGPAEPNDQSALGGGYAFLAAANMLTQFPEADLQIYNRGISGNKVYQLAERWQADCLDLEPDVLSILIGVNDIWHHLNGQYDGTVETYRTDYHALMERTKEALPNVKIVVCEPFVLKTGAVDAKWFPKFDGFRAAAKEIADQYANVWVPFQSMFDEAVKLAPPATWARDGVHPTGDGAALMAHAWVTAVSAA